MLLLVLRLSVAMTLLTVTVATTSYCATINSTTSSGASGYFAMKVDPGYATYSFYLDLSNFIDSAGVCSSNNIASGLNYHIHTYWQNTEKSSYGTSCSSSYTGGHYDPYLACASASQSYSTSCASLGRTSSSYICSSSLFASGNRTECEVGDLSGKFGKSIPTTGSIFSSGPYVDYRPPDEINYGTSTPKSFPWTSVVFHCGSARVLCALLSKTDLTACAPAFTSSPTTTPTVTPTTTPTVTPTSSPVNDLTVFGDKQKSIAAIVVICVVGGIIIGGLVIGLILTYLSTRDQQPPKDAKKLIDGSEALVGLNTEAAL